MRAMVFDRYGEPEVTNLTDVPLEDAARAHRIMTDAMTARSGVLPWSAEKRIYEWP